MSLDGPEPPDYGPMAKAQEYAADLQYKASQEALALSLIHI